MHVEKLEIAGAYRLTPEVHGDDRGFFMEAYNSASLREIGIELEVLQHNHSRSQAGVLRGLHFQWDQPLDKLVRVISGRAYVVVVDIRKNSPTYKKWIATEASAENKLQVYMPFGCASGFYAYEDGTEVEYYYSAFYNKDGESNIRYDDIDIGISWPEGPYILSERDRTAETLQEWELRPESNLF